MCYGANWFYSNSTATREEIGCQETCVMLIVTLSQKLMKHLELHTNMLQRVTSLTDKQVLSNDGRGYILSWKPLLESYALELQPLCDSILKGVRLAICIAHT